MAEKKPKADADVKAKRKAEAAAVALRVEEVLRIRLDGAQFHDVVQYAAEKGWGLQERQIRTYIQRADELLVERLDRSRRKVVARHLAQRQALFARATNAADYRTALAVLADEAKLRGLYPEKEIRELVKLAAAQGTRIEELERRLADAHAIATTPPPAAAECGEARPPSGEDAGGSGGEAGPLPLGPLTPDG
jgi:hypothetical protein